MKFHWGTGLFTFYGLFVIAFLVVLYFAAQSKTDLISDTYYEDGVNYQTVIDKKNNSNRLQQDITVDATGEGITIHFPENIQTVSATVKLVRISDKNFDRQFETQQHTFIIPKSETVPGLYQLQIDWTGDDTAYYFEENIYAQ